MNKPAPSLLSDARRVRPALVASAGLIIVLLAGLMFFSGCTVQTGVDTNVNADTSGTVGMRLAADKELQDALSGVVDGVGGQVGGILGILGDLGGLGGGLPTTVDDLFNLVLGQIPSDWKVERGTDSSGARWISVTRPFANPEELQQILSGRFLSTIIATDKFSLTQDNGFFTSKTRYSATADAGSVTSRGQSAAGLAQGVLGTVLTIENRVTLPGTLKDNNADEVRGNTLVWNVGTSGSKEMQATSTIYNWGAIAGTVILGVAIIAGLVIILVLILRRRRRKPAPEPPGAAQPAGEAQPTPSSPPATAAAVAPEPEVRAEPLPEPASEPMQAAEPALEEAAVSGSPTVAAALETADTPRPIVPIPLRPTRSQPVNSSDRAPTPESQNERSEPADREESTPS